MRFRIVLLSLVTFAGCEAKLVNKVGYAKTLDRKLEEHCFDRVFGATKKFSRYQLSIKKQVEKSKVLSYELTIDGQSTGEKKDTFIPSSFQLSQKFLKQLNEQCPLR